ncbi:MAG: twin-arginine translocase TatA/TatE family subunit [Deltaproteobacteria bacterium]|nr:twin-arginine translocase TatA/TatE family subunit [Deltaproteobacteria bacterium]
MFGVSMWELLVVLILLSILVGPEKLPELAKSLGKTFGKVRKSMDEIKKQTALPDEFNVLSDKDHTDRAPAAPPARGKSTLKGGKKMVDRGRSKPNRRVSNPPNDEGASGS